MASPTGLTRTTLSAALNDSDAEIYVASTTGLANGRLIYIRGEVIKVSDTASTLANPIGVVRGYDGTRTKSHPSGAKLYHGAPDVFKSLYSNAKGLFGDSGTFPQYLIPGAKATDDDGNEYVMVEASAQIYTGVTCAISLDGNFTAAVHTDSLRGSIGVAVEQIDSTEFGWLQIYGYHAAAQNASGDSAATSTQVVVGATSVSSPAAGMATIAGTTVEAALIYGMYCVGAASSATTSAASFAGVSVPVWLHYPYATGIHDFTLDPTSS